MKTPLSYFSDELLLLVAGFLERESDINALARTNRRFCSLFNPYLYRHNALTSGSSALFWAAARGSEAMARFCISEGADVEAFDEDGRTPRSCAVMSGQEAMAKLLLEYTQVDPDLKDSDGFSSLSLAASNGHETLVKLLLET